MDNKRSQELLQICYDKLGYIINQGWGEFPDKKWYMEELGISEEEYMELEGLEE